MGQHLPDDTLKCIMPNLFQQSLANVICLAAAQLQSWHLTKANCPKPPLYGQLYMLTAPVVEMFSAAWLLRFYRVQCVFTAEQVFRQSTSGLMTEIQPMISDHDPNNS